MAEAQERTLKTNVSNAEATVRGLKEQLQRMKTTVLQVRAQCANDIRKRDLEMQKLRSHLADRQRGKREGLGVTTININSTVDQDSKPKFPSGGEGVHDPGYSLKQETTDFLTELCQNLSDENDALIALARDTVHTLKDLQGLLDQEEEDQSDGVVRQSQGPATNLPASHEELSIEMDTVLAHLRTLLTNPSFVPLEEVEIRDKEIMQLRESWERMESRWKQAVTTMDGWHQRISDGGNPVRADELQMELALKHSADSTKQQQSEAEATAAITSNSGNERTEQTQGISRERALKRANPNDSEQQAKERKIAKVSGRALQERSENSKPTKSPRKVSFKPAVQESPDNPNGEDETLRVKAHESNSVSQRSSRKRLETKPAAKRNTNTTVG